MYKYYNFVEIVAKCDNCGIEECYTITSKNDAKNELKRQGWKFSSKYCLCKECYNK